MVVTVKSLEKIIIEAERQKFGRGIHDKMDRQTFMEGVMFVLSRIPEGRQVLLGRGYRIEEVKNEKTNASEK